ncbi:MAG: hypothetical protein ACI9QA_000225 [Methanobacteriota archaeon]|jgi:hypothetical protein|uniref:Uncharacterized protein n=1 Tax=Halorutilus salinus TaxID=2487751 RepID=A0A9Q4C111_9EURY|nr:hypothetical protein [Halorutilus salinus]MCX2817950.1 hypothetical protein [Halorutilus salinus]
MSAEAPASAEKREAHLRGVKVTTMSCVFGVLAAVVSWIVTPEEALQTFPNVGVVVFGVAVAAQKPFLPRLGKHEMSKKDWLYVGFMTFDLWFITWTVLLTAGNAV